MAPCPVNGSCPLPLGASTIGLIYVNPEGPEEVGRDGVMRPNPDPAKSAQDIRSIFARMGWNDRQTVALVGGGHAFGKAHGACPKGAGLPPDQAPLNPWPGNCGTGKGNDTYTSGIEGPWTTTPTRWGNEYFRYLLQFQWEKHIGPGGKIQWWTEDRSGPASGLMRMTTDVAFLADSAYRKLVQEFAASQARLDEAFGPAWQELMTNGQGWLANRRCLKVRDVFGPRRDRSAAAPVLP